uniref:Uncharacterized protein n=1 Tax=Lepeophtheirus salmonis TaxID=72036 RepID=A0A0K2TYJ6_LEPSM
MRTLLLTFIAQGPVKQFQSMKLRQKLLMLCLFSCITRHFHAKNHLRKRLSDQLLCISLGRNNSHRDF